MAIKNRFFRAGARVALAVTLVSSGPLGLQGCSEAMSRSFRRVMQESGKDAQRRRQSQARQAERDCKERVKAVMDIDLYRCATEVAAINLKKCQKAVKAAYKPDFDRCER